MEKRVWHHHPLWGVLSHFPSQAPPSGRHMYPPTNRGGKKELKIGDLGNSALLQHTEATWEAPGLDPEWA